MTKFHSKYHAAFRKMIYNSLLKQKDHKKFYEFLWKLYINNKT